MIRTRLYPLSLTIAVIVLDQVTKALVVARVDPYNIISEHAGGLLRIIHVRNPVVAFSLGSGLPEPWRSVLVIVLPSIVVAGVLWYYWTGADLTNAHRWMLAGVLGGGIGNLIDRFIRSQGVVDFIDVEFFGIFGLARWPTFNVADAAVVISGLLFIMSVIRYEYMQKRKHET
ncbi:MAG: signal peptidase II [bacterium]